MSVPAAFLNMADPYSWLLRGLCEYQWSDLTTTPQAYPQQTGRGFDASPMLNPMSRFGLRLVTLALDYNNQWYREDGSYQFEVRLVNDPRQSYCLLLRSDEMAFSKLIPWNTTQPMHSVGHIHESVIEATREFVERRKRREGISSIDLQEMLNHPIIPPPPNLIAFLQQRLMGGADMNTAMQEGLWGTPHTPPPSAPQPVVPTESAPLPQPNFNPPPNSSSEQSTNQATSPSWTIGVGAGRGQIIGDTGLADQGHSAAMVIIEPACKWLQYTAFMGIFMGGLAFVNGLFTLYMTSSGNVVRGSGDNLYFVVMILSFGLGVIGLGGGGSAVYLFDNLRSLKANSFKWIPLLFALLYPLTWPLGIPSALYGLSKLRDPKVSPYWNR